MNQPERVPSQAWLVTFAGTAINLCLGILYAWSVWKATLIATPEHPAGTQMEGVNKGWVYLAPDEATWAYAICGFVFALFMIPGGRIQDKYGPKIGATLGVKLGTVRSRIHRGRQALRASLERRRELAQEARA